MKCAYGTGRCELPALILATMRGQKTSPDTLTALETPALVLDIAKAERNVARLKTASDSTWRDVAASRQDCQVDRCRGASLRGSARTGHGIDHQGSRILRGWRLHRHNLCGRPGARQDPAPRRTVRGRRRHQDRARHSRSGAGIGGRREPCRENAWDADRDRLRRPSRRSRAGRSQPGEDRRHPARRQARTAWRADPCRRIVRLSQWRGVGRGRGGRARRRGRGSRAAARTRLRLSGRKCRLDANRALRARSQWRYRSARGRLHVLRSRHARHRGLRDRRHRVVSAGNGHWAQTGEGVDSHRWRLDGLVT